MTLCGLPNGLQHCSLSSGIVEPLLGIAYGDAPKLYDSGVLWLATTQPLSRLSG